MAPRLPSLNWLRVFEAAARCESFARAAVQLNMSAAAVSQQIKALESQLGAELFTRQAHAVKLTEAGRAYLPVVAQALGVLEGATEGLFGQRAQDQLFVQSVLLYAHGVLAPRMADFMEKFPDVALRLTTGNRAEEFSHGFHDLRIVFGTPSQFGAQSDPLQAETLYPVARADVVSQIRDAHDVLGFPLIEVATHRAGWPHVFDALGLRARAVRWIYADSTIMAAALAAGGAGIALARAPASDRIMAAHGLHACLDAGQVSGTDRYHLVYEDRASLRPAARAFRDWVLT